MVTRTNTLIRLRPVLATAFLLLIFHSPIASQSKFEREERIKVSEVPTTAVDFVAALELNQKIKWYREEGINRTSIEAKTCHARKKYSIEFDATGNLEDIEIEIDWEEIPEPTCETIQSYLRETYVKYRLDKVQLQYTGSAQVLQNTVRGKPGAETPTIHYEIVLRARDGTDWTLLEYLFSETGAVIRRSTIILRNTDNLEY